MLDIWFWQQIFSPHMSGLASALSRQGCDVTYVAQSVLSDSRMKLGWTAPDSEGLHLYLAPSQAVVRDLVRQAQEESVHICEGVRANGLVSVAQFELARRKLRQWVVMETVDDYGPVGVVKRMAYSLLSTTKRRSIEGVLAAGHTTTDWIVARGMPKAKVFPFAYFLPDVACEPIPLCRHERPVRFIFVGQLIRRKRVDILIKQLGHLNDLAFDFFVIGEGPEHSRLRKLADSKLPGRVRWLGNRTRSDVLRDIASGDCLVLPSHHDGWGAVISEALMAGTPAICSEACGAADVVRRSGVGGVFESSEPNELRALLAAQIEAGPITREQRLRISQWAKSLGSNTGAKYLLKILDCSTGAVGERPLPPWNC